MTLSPNLMVPTRSIPCGVAPPRVPQKRNTFRSRGKGKSDKASSSTFGSSCPLHLGGITFRPTSPSVECSASLPVRASLAKVTAFPRGAALDQSALVQDAPNAHRAWCTTPRPRSRSGSGMPQVPVVGQQLRRGSAPGSTSHSTDGRNLSR